MIFLVKTFLYTANRIVLCTIFIKFLNFPPYTLPARHTTDTNHVFYRIYCFKQLRRLLFITRMRQKSSAHTVSCHAPALACEKSGCFAVHFCTARFSPAQIAIRPRWVALLRSYSSALHLRRGSSFAIANDCVAIRWVRGVSTSCTVFLLSATRTSAPARPSPPRRRGCLLFPS